MDLCRSRGKNIYIFVPLQTYTDSDTDVFSFGVPLNTSILFVILLHLVIESNSLVSMFCICSFEGLIHTLFLSWQRLAQNVW